MDLRTVLFSFGGRLGRLSYWLTVAGMAFLLPIGTFLLIALSLSSPVAATLFAIAFYLPMIWIGLAIATKRLHDRDRSAGWLLVFYLLPSLLGQVANRMVHISSGMLGAIVVASLGAGLTLWGIVELGFLPGTAGPNRFGPGSLAGPPNGVD